MNLSSSIRNILGIVDALYIRIANDMNLDKQMITNMTHSNKFSLVQRHMMELLQSLDNVLPFEVLTVCRHEINEKWLLKYMDSRETILTHKRFEMLNKQIQEQKK